MKFAIIYGAQAVDTWREAEFALPHELVDQSVLAEAMRFVIPHYRAWHASQHAYYHLLPAAGPGLGSTELTA